MTVIRSTDARVTETPNGVMTTFASPTQGGTAASLWRVEVQPGVTGPLHIIDAEQIWTFVAGNVTISVDGEEIAVGEGDTAILPANVTRQLTAGPDGFTALVTAPGTALASVPSGASGIAPPWIV
ncbi:MAG TPA: cupin [Micromonosporaceae bacterium]|nr:cupin [Micromonosporaceae bacterium]HCU52656.1 cupin [Micromonosporaceae bacterium]